jgi:PadR family transcriptional regulator PadR
MSSGLLAVPMLRTVRDNIRKVQPIFRQHADCQPPYSAPDRLRLLPGQDLAREASLTNLPVAFPEEACHSPVGNQDGGAMKQKTDVLQGTLALMVLKTLDVLGTLHGYGIARRIEQISGNLLAVNQGTLYPVLLKLEQEGAIASDWGTSENNRRARFYRLTRDGRKQLQAETQDWEQTAAIIGRFFEAKAEDLP